MKQKLIFLLLLVTSTFSSCTILLPQISGNYTSHQDVMQKYRSKYQVRSSFGMPTYRNVIDGVEFWYYDYGTISTGSSYQTPLGYGSLRSTNTSTSNTYVEFQFQGEQVINWRTQGVNFAKGTSKSDLYVWGALIDFFVVFFAIMIPLGTR